eukprot:1187467-Rhodomonas_salina.1
MVAASKLTPTKKLHTLTPWDGKTHCFPYFDKNVQQLTSTYGITFITEAGLALFAYYVQKRDDARIAGVPLAFNEKIHEWTDCNITPVQLVELNTHFKLRLQGNSTTKLQ